MIRNHSIGYSNPFVGRTSELADITARLENPECRLLTLTGLGGSGKTRLAAEAANRLEAQFPQGTFFVGLQPLTRSNLLVPTIAQAVGLTFYGEDDLQGQLLDYLHDKTLLLILDNFEHLLDEAALVDDILDNAPDVKILVTSREALSLQQEWVYLLKGMSIPPNAYATPLEEYEAVQLFLYHARRVQPNFDLAHERESVIRICMMTAGFPLAIELATSWLKGLSCTQIVQEMQCNLDFLSTTTRNVEERHRSMRAVFDQSWKLLSENERLIFARLSVFLGGFDGDAAEQVADISFSSLAGLVEKSLVQMESANRFSIHELLRQYTLEKLDAFGETEATHARHSQYFAQRMLRYETALKQPQQLETMQAIERDFENIRLAWDWSAKHQQVTNLNTMLNGLYLFGFLGSRHSETITIIQNTLELPISDASLAGRLMVRRWGFLHWWYQADYQEALTEIERTLQIAAAEDNRFEVAFCHLMAAYALICMQQFAKALPHLETSKILFEDLNEPFYVCWTLHRLGYAYANLNQTDKDIEYTEQSLALARVIQDRFALVISLYNLGSVYILNGNSIKAKYYAEEALAFDTASAHRCQMAHALSLLALCAFYEGDYDTCQEYADRSQAIIEDLSLLVIQPYSFHLLILLACLREDYVEAICQSELGKRHSTNLMDVQLQYWARAVLACGLGNPSETRLHIQKVLQFADSKSPDSVLNTWIVPCMACMLAATHPQKAVELLAWSFAYPDTALNWIRQWSVFDQLQSQLQQAMDKESYQAHWKKGEALTVDDIITEVHLEFCESPHLAAETYQQPLTAREAEILSLMAVGMTNPQIAGQLVIGAGTVKTHTLSIYRKLDVANRTQAIVRAQEVGLLQA